MLICSKFHELTAAPARVRPAYANATSNGALSKAAALYAAADPLAAT
jgi:hypothetical protein